MCCGTDPEFVYALDQDHRVLYMISTKSDMIMPEVWLPEIQPLAMSYSEADNSLYIASRFSGKITVYDLDTGTFSDLMFSPYADGMDIEVAPQLRRVFVLAPNNSSDSFLYALDMDTGKTIFPGLSVYGNSLAIDAQREKLFVGERHAGRVTRYSFKNDALVKEDVLMANDHSLSNIEISHDGLHVLFHHDMEGGLGYALYDYDATDFNHLYGKWYFDDHVQRAAYGPYDQYLYVVTHDELNPYLLVMNAQNYQPITAFPFPNSGDYAIFAPRNERAHFAGFSCTDDGEDRRIYLFPGN
jgi:hypothetical protein